MAEELIIIAVVVLAIIFFWGGKRVPDLARQAGRVTKDVQQAYKEGLSPSTRTEEATTSDLLIETAKKIGIDTDGKRREQISEEIIKKAKSST